MNSRCLSALSGVVVVTVLGAAAQDRPQPPKSQMPDLGRPTRPNDEQPLFNFDEYFLGTWKFEWDVPETLFDEGFPEEAFVQQIKQDAVVRLFAQGRISSGYAAALLGWKRRDFLEFLQRQGLPLAQYTEADCDDVADAMRKVARALIGG